MDHIIRAILLSATSSSEALQRFYTEKKINDRRCSLRALCDAAGLTSTGYLSDVLKGKRKLHVKYRRSIAKAFGLSGACARCFAVLVDLDHAKDPAIRKKLERKLALVRKALRFERPPMAARLEGLFFATEVFCAFGLYRSQPTEAELIAYFGDERSHDVTTALSLLERLGVAQLEACGRYSVINSQILFGSQPGGLTHLEFLRLALGDALGSLERWFPQQESSHFVSSVISVRYDDYVTKLAKFKTDLLMVQAGFEAEDADRLVRFNIQVYPVTSQKSGAT